ncbi:MULTISPECIES: helix-turn-helix domain-containing protein [Pseudoalteromonas]|uniref:MerR family transcriptional regulator n=1 Tax=Pseudoalteromonas amylolytica TaxID=1859457 RepID=A0A1S1MYN0_9GAMM|nr:MULTISPECIES: helix-turn-helix domain-containing protein [Pseudoalteromonas]MCF6437215.1 helix-turn-helix domain-containing protein [Pseudoalteromonas sp. MMG022]OHU90526.1 MerR family transcriptional regulator [Pseudoalteromonas sp. JW3]OHU92852.1 MerR family transcriptional regulator [Pseudoalteromonas amylolytica]
MSTQSELDIQQVSLRSGLPSSTIRYYEEKGLIKPLGRKGLTRIFNANVLEKLSVISLGQFAGFSLDEIRVLLESGTASEIDRSRLIEKSEEIERSIKLLSVISDTLQHVAHCPEHNQFDCAKFQNLLKKATRLQHKGVKKMKFK